MGLTVGCVHFFNNNIGFGLIVGIAVVLVLGFSIVKSFMEISKKVGFMFNSIENDDFTFRFISRDNKASSQKYVNDALNRIKLLVLNAREEARRRERYYENILNQINTGIVIFSDSGVVFQINDACLKLLGISQLTHLRQLDGIHNAISNEMMRIEDGDVKIVKFYDEISQVTLSLTCAQISTYQQDAKVVTVVDIAGEINNTEMESWQRLSRVLTHEIMNSLAPITSLSESLLNVDDVEIKQRGLGVINETAKGLTSFVENYRKLTRIPQPDLKLVDVNELVCTEVSLFDLPIEVIYKTSACYVNIDKVLISQVLANLIKNAVEAKGKVWIVLGRKENGNLFIDICNDGEPISDELRENIFIPFFTTKEHGSGVGLSLSRQIMRVHNGTLTLSTKPHTTFRLQF